MKIEAEISCAPLSTNYNITKATQCQSKDDMDVIKCFKQLNGFDKIAWYSLG